MNSKAIKTGIYLIVVAALLVITFTTNDVIYSEAAAAMGVIAGAIAFKNLSTKQQTK